MFHIVLVHPEIPPNTGNIIRLCANTGAQLHLIEPLGFSMDDKQLRRAGLDYHEYAPVQRYASWEAFELSAVGTPERRFAMTTKGSSCAFEHRFQAEDCFVFGSETSGLPAPLVGAFPTDQRLRIPMLAGQRSLNLSNTVAVLTYEAWRQNSFSGAQTRAVAPSES
jgi:tRNA (cytidine/uridine-2'-O-)-methyltransferase